MILTKATIKNFRSIKDATIDFDPRVTVMVGPNESGKSNILLGIKKFFSREEFSSEDLFFHSKEETPTIECKFNIVKEEKQKLSELLQGIKTGNCVWLERISNEYRVKAEQKQHNQEETQGTVVSQEQIEQLFQIFPSMVYFPASPETFIRGKEIDISLFVENPNEPKNKIILDLLSLCDLTIDNLKEPSIQKRVKKLFYSEAVLSEKINATWKQEDVKFRLTSADGKLLILLRDGKNLNSDDEKTWIWTCPEDRSDGFRWYLTFYCHFLAGTEGAKTKSLMLLDDPGYFLHADAKSDLLDRFEEISKNDNQIIYTTHSPFLINWNKQDRIRLVEKGTSGTIASSDWAKKKEWELPEPLRSIGVRYRGQLLSENTLIVEGLSDKLIIGKIREIFSQEQKLQNLDSKVNVFVAGSASEAIGPALMLKNDKLNYLILVDADKEGKETKDRAKTKAGGLNILLVNEALQQRKLRKKTIEDLLPFETYVEAVNLSHKEIFGESWINIDPGFFKGAGGRTPVVEKIESYIQSKMKEIKDDDPLKRKAAARILMELMSIDNFIRKEDEKKTKSALYFEKVFSRINTHFGL